MNARAAVRWAIAGACMLAPAAVNAAAIVFDGSVVFGCSLDRSTYTCATSPSTFADTVDIAGGYVVNANLNAGTATIGAAGGVKGTLTTQSTLTLGANAWVIGNVTAGTTVALAADAYITGDLLAGTTAALGAAANVSGRLVSGTTTTLVAGAFVCGDVDAKTTMTMAAGAFVGANMQSPTVTMAADSYVNGHLKATTATLAAGTCYGSIEVITLTDAGNGVCTLPRPTTLCTVQPQATLDHILISHTGSGLTCTPSTVTLTACANASCVAPNYAGGVTVTLGPGNQSFTIDSSGVNNAASVSQTTAGTVTLTAQGNPAAQRATACRNTADNSASCSMVMADAGFLIDVPNHVSETPQSVTLSAVRKADNATLCVPAFASVSKSVNFTCRTANPGTGTLPLRVGGLALNSAKNNSGACDAAGQVVNLAFNSNGTASTSLQYGDVGQMMVSARYSGSGSDAGLVMTGSKLFVVAPASFAFSGITGSPIKAGTAFSASVSARNSLGDTTPNFGRESAAETATLAFTRAQPTGIGASDGYFTGNLDGFTSGLASAVNLVWSEVGAGDLNASLTGGSYLGSGLTASGSTGSSGAVGRFIPHHFTVAVKPACSNFTYAAQPFSVTVTAMNGLATPTVTVNYDGSADTQPNFAQSVGLSDAPALGLGGFGNTGNLAMTLFNAGVASSATPTYSFSAKLTAAQTLRLRARDVDGVSSSGFSEGSTALRSGRLRLSNAFGSERSALSLPVQAQYWSGNAWVLNDADSCTRVPAAAVVRAVTLDQRGATTTAWSSSASAIVISGGNGMLMMAAPLPAATGSVDLSLNLGSSGVDQSCLAVHPTSSAAALPWLRSQNGACSALWDRDPSARASFGIYPPETRRTIDVREHF